jgi:predicted ATPase
MEAHQAMGAILLLRGELLSAREHFEQAMSLYDPRLHRPLAIIYGQDPKISSLSPLAWALWELGYPDQALKRSYEALSMAQERSHPYSLAFALGFAAWIHQYRREDRLAQERTEAAMELSSAQGVPLWFSWATITKGWSLALQGHVEQGINQIRQGSMTLQTMGAELQRSYFLALLAEAYEKAEHPKEGLKAVAEALTHVDDFGEHYYEAELYRLKGELTLQSKVKSEKWKEEKQRAKSKRQKAKIEINPQPPIPNPQAEAEAEACFLKALDIARKQQAKSLELRATVSLARLWRRQGKQHEAHNMLAEIYHWCTEGFDTKDLQEAQGLLTALAEQKPKRQKQGKRQGT